MEKYNYFENVCEDIRNYISEHEIKVTNLNREEVEEELNDKLFIEDCITGNASGSYTFNAWQAEEYLAHNWDLLEEAMSEFCCSDENPIEKGAEWCDVTIRCYLLGQCLGKVLDELEEEDEEEEWEEEDED